MRNELDGFRVSGRTIHFSPEKPLPAALVTRIVQARVRENEAACEDEEGEIAAAELV